MGDQDHKAVGFEALPIHTYMPSFACMYKILQHETAIGFEDLAIHTYKPDFAGRHTYFFKFLHMKGQNVKKYPKFDLFKEI